MVKIKNLAEIMLFVIVLVTFAACDGTETEGNVAPATEKETEEPLETQEIAAKIAFEEGYSNIAALSADSDKIAVVRVLDGGICEGIGGIPWTINQVEVIAPLYNCKKGEVIEHSTPGGIYGGIKYSANDVEQLVKDQEYLLFMKQASNGRYVDLNYDWGRLIYDNGKVTSVHADLEEQDGSGLAQVVDYDIALVRETMETVLNLPITSSAMEIKYQSRDYPVKSYDSWEALFQDSDAVCVIQVLPLAADHFTEADYFCAAVKEVLFGEAETDIKLTTENIMAWDGSIRWEMLDDPWMNEGEEYLVFLKKEDGDGKYHVTGKSQGRFLLENGELTSLKALYPERIKQGLDVENQSFEAWKTEVFHHIVK